MMNNSVKETEKLIEKYEMIREGDVVIAGVSGGADSVCLLFVLWELQAQLGFELRVCHVNHCLRGEAADEDEEYVRRLCNSLNVPCRIFRRNVELIAKNRKQSTEEAGRAVRREAFEQMCEEEQQAGGRPVKIATAHHKDDNAETMLLNISRGTGLKGLRGIMPRQGKWIHPLLALTRQEIEEMLKERGISWREDATNDEDDYTRNRIRHNILPAMIGMINEGTVRHLEELSLQAEEVWEYLEEGVKQAWSRCVSQNAQPEGALCINKDGLAGCFPAVKKQLVRHAIAKVRGQEKDLTAVHVRDVLELFDRQVGRQVQLPGNVIARRTYEGVLLIRQEKTAEIRQQELKLDIPGRESWSLENGEKRYEIETCFVEKGTLEKARAIPQKSYTKWFDYGIIEHGLCIRTRRQGDYIAIDGSGKRQKLKSWFINEKIPQEQRNRILLIADGSHVVWIPGYRMSSAYQVSEETGKIVEIKITEENKNGRDN